jgi:putative FmdB family regulatory protein
MPLYEYECDACGHRFEVIVKFSDPPIEKCPTCGGAVHKLMSSPAIQFKGTGWYITDYARKDADKKQGGEKKDSGEKKETNESTDTKESSTAKSDTAPSDTSAKPADSKPAASSSSSSKD